MLRRWHQVFLQNKILTLFKCLTQFNLTLLLCFFTDGFTFLKKHHAALSQRLKSVQSLMDHLLEENVISQKEYDTIRNCTSVKQQTGQLIDLVLSKGNAAAEVFRNWIKKNDVYLLRELMGM